MDYHHEEMGRRQCKYGMINYTEVDGGIFGVNLRYPTGLDFDAGIQALNKTIEKTGLQLKMSAISAALRR